MLGKKITFMATLLVFLLMLSACGGEKSTNTNTGEDTTASASDEVITLKIAHSETPESMYEKGVKELAKQLEEESNGRFEVEVYPNGQLGSQTSLVEQVQLGSVHMTLQSPPVLGNFVEEANVMSLPFIWPNEEAIFNTLDNDELINPFVDAMEEKGLKFLGAWGGGFKQMTNKDHAITSPSDIEGLNFRVIPGPIPQQTYKLLGANAETIDYSELYNSLQLGVVDGQDNTYEAVNNMKFYEVQNYLTETNHDYYTNIAFVNSEWFEGLPADLRDTFIEVHGGVMALEREWATEDEAKHKKGLEELIEIHEISNDERQSFIDATKPVYETYADTDRKKELLDSILNAIE